MKNLNAEFAFDVDMELNSHFVEERFKKLERIKQAVAEGSYKVNSKNLANILILKLISELAPLDSPNPDNSSLLKNVLFKGDSRA